MDPNMSEDSNHAAQQPSQVEQTVQEMKPGFSQLRFIISRLRTHMQSKGLLRGGSPKLLRKLEEVESNLAAISSVVDHTQKQLGRSIFSDYPMLGTIQHNVYEFRNNVLNCFPGTLGLIEKRDAIEAISNKVAVEKANFEAALQLGMQREQYRLLEESLDVQRKASIAQHATLDQVDRITTALQSSIAHLDEATVQGKVKVKQGDIMINALQALAEASDAVLSPADRPESAYILPKRKVTLEAGESSGSRLLKPDELDQTIQDLGCASPVQTEGPSPGTEQADQPCVHVQIDQSAINSSEAASTFSHAIRENSMPPVTTNHSPIGIPTRPNTDTPRDPLQASLDTVASKQDAPPKNINVHHGLDTAEAQQDVAQSTSDLFASFGTAFGAYVQALAEDSSAISADVAGKAFIGACVIGSVTASAAIANAFSSCTSTNISRKKFAWDKAEALKKEKSDESKAEVSGTRPPSEGSGPDLPDDDGDSGNAGGDLLRRNHVHSRRTMLAVKTKKGVIADASPQPSIQRSETEIRQLFEQIAEETVRRMLANVGPIPYGLPVDVDGSSQRHQLPDRKTSDQLDGSHGKPSVSSREDEAAETDGMSEKRRGKMAVRDSPGQDNNYAAVLAQSPVHSLGGSSIWENTATPQNGIKLDRLNPPVDANLIGQQVDEDQADFSEEGSNHTLSVEMSAPIRDQSSEDRRQVLTSAILVKSGDTETMIPRVSKSVITEGQAMQANEQQHLNLYGGSMTHADNEEEVAQPNETSPDLEMLNAVEEVVSATANSNSQPCLAVTDVNAGCLATSEDAEHQSLLPAIPAAPGPELDVAPATENPGLTSAESTAGVTSPRTLSLTSDATGSLDGLKSTSQTGDKDVAPFPALEKHWDEDKPVAEGM